MTPSYDASAAHRQTVEQLRTEKAELFQAVEYAISMLAEGQMFGLMPEDYSKIEKKLKVAIAKAGGAS